MSVCSSLQEVLNKCHRLNDTHRVLTTCPQSGSSILLTSGTSLTAKSGGEPLGPGATPHCPGHTSSSAHFQVVTGTQYPKEVTKLQNAFSFSNFYLFFSLLFLTFIFISTCLQYITIRFLMGTWYMYKTHSFHAAEHLTYGPLVDHHSQILSDVCSSGCCDGHF